MAAADVANRFGRVTYAGQLAMPVSGPGALSPACRIPGVVWRSKTQAVTVGPLVCACIQT